MAILASEIISGWIGQLNSETIFRIGLLEYAQDRSIYNFDITLALLRLYDSLGMGVSF